MKLTKEKKIVAEIIEALCDRSGFDDWWGNLDTDTKNEITIELVRIINSKIKSQTQ